jgi:hypothetical protein
MRRDLTCEAAAARFVIASPFIRRMAYSPETASSASIPISGSIITHTTLVGVRMRHVEFSTATHAEFPMMHVARPYTIGRMATVLILLGSGLACEPSRIAAPPAERVLWKAPGHPFLVAPSYDATSVFFGSRDHQVVAVDRRTGTVRWRSSTRTGLEVPPRDGIPWLPETS